MSDDSERWDRVQGASPEKAPFRPKASAVSLHTDPARRRNLDKEEAARDRMVFRWVLLLVGLLMALTLMFFLITRLSGPAEP